MTTYSRWLALNSLALACIAYGRAAGAHAHRTSNDCPTAQFDTSGWKLVRDGDIGIELKHPRDYEEKHWESRSDTSGAVLSFRVRATRTVDFHQMLGFWSNQRPRKTAAPCQLQMRSGELTLYLERSSRRLSTGHDTVYYIGMGFFTPAGKPRTVVEVGAPDSTALLEQLMMLRTIRFLGRPQ